MLRFFNCVLFHLDTKDEGQAFDEISKLATSRESTAPEQGSWFEGSPELPLPCGFSVADALLGYTVLNLSDHLECV